MRFNIPRNNLDEMVIYIWKIVDLPYILYDDLLFNVIFEYFIFTPDEASLFIEDVLKKSY
jgi:hypothetical protein